MALAKRFPQLVSEEDLEELSNEVTTYDSNRAILPADLDVERFWFGVSEMEDAEGTKRFPILSKLAKGILILPHGNADVERLFSHVTLIKTQKRNLLHDDTVNAILHAKFNKAPCHTFQPDITAIKQIKRATKTHVLPKKKPETAVNIIEDATNNSTDPSSGEVASGKRQKTLTDMFAAKRTCRPTSKHSDYLTGDYYVSDSSDE